LSLHDLVPDETTICGFRGLLAKKGVGKRLFVLLATQLDAQCLLVKLGLLIDATLLTAQPQPPWTGQPSPDPHADWVKKAKTAISPTSFTSLWIRAAA
jgi:IS5 family transposase